MVESVEVARNPALGPLLTLSSSGGINRTAGFRGVSALDSCVTSSIADGLIRFLGSVSNSALNRPVKPPNIGCRNQIRGRMVEFRLGPAGNTAQYRRP